MPIVANISEWARDRVASAAFNLFPSACVIMTEGIVTVGSAPPIPGGGEPAALFTMTTPTAPAS